MSPEPQPISLLYSSLLLESDVFPSGTALFFLQLGNLYKEQREPEAPSEPLLPASNLMLTYRLSLLSLCNHSEPGGNVALSVILTASLSVCVCGGGSVSILFLAAGELGNLELIIVHV